MSCDGRWAQTSGIKITNLPHSRLRYLFKGMNKICNQNLPTVLRLSTRTIADDKHLPNNVLHCAIGGQY